jgi:hypothetical protein
MMKWVTAQLEKEAIRRKSKDKGTKLHQALRVAQRKKTALALVQRAKKFKHRATRRNLEQYLITPVATFHVGLEDLRIREVYME